MRFWSKKGPGRTAGSGSSSRSSQENGILVFSHTSEVIKAETVLRAAGLPVKVMGPPPDLQSGCDMVVLFPLLKQLEVQSVLEQNKLEALQILPHANLLLEPVSLFNTIGLGRWLMVRAANMKITLDQSSGEIVNISGGGCPDVPYLAGLMVGHKISQVEPPKKHGRTLCSYSLQKAFEEARGIMASPDKQALVELGELKAEPCHSQQFDFKLHKISAPRPWLICGTIPDEAFPLTLYPDGYEQVGQCLQAKGGVPALDIKRGTPALLAAAAAGCLALGVPQPSALLVGDCGTGQGSSKLYRHLAETVIPGQIYRGITFHYLFPDLDGHNLVYSALEDLNQDLRPLLVADAGYMYVAKMSGYAQFYDLFTPDLGELAFLADESAPHPFYTRGFLLAGDLNPTELAVRAYEHNNSAKYLLIKGSVDYLAKDGQILNRVDCPLVPALEPIGGTGDMVAGLSTAFLAAGYDLPSACLGGALAARLVGQLANPKPDTQVAELTDFIPRAVAETLRLTS